MRLLRNIPWIMTSLIVLSTSVAAAYTPDQVGPYDYDIYSTSLRDELRSRSMELEVLYPLYPSEEQQVPRPLIVFSHGFLLSASRYRSYAEHLVSHGFVVALPSFPTSFLNVNHVKLAQDVRFVIDYLLGACQDPAHVLYQRIDPEEIGTSGHSLGGKLSLLEATSDDRIDAIGVLDPVDEGNPIWNDPIRYPSVAPELMPEIQVPLLFVGAELGKVLVSFSPCAPEDENYQRFYEAANPPAIEITQLDVGHGQYVDEDVEEDDPCARGEVPSVWVRSSSAAYLTAFFLGHLCSAQDALDWLDERLAQDEAEGKIVVRRK
jgi:pimeloyl-ACP methyl ester carboxylesterase